MLNNWLFFLLTFRHTPLQHFGQMAIMEHINGEVFFKEQLRIKEKLQYYPIQIEHSTILTP